MNQSKTSKRSASEILSGGLKSKKSKIGGHSNAPKLIKAICLKQKPSEDDIQELFLEKYSFMGITTERAVGFFSDIEGLCYRYGGKVHVARPMTEWLKGLQDALQRQFPKALINCANVNYYPKSTSGRLSRHQDDEQCHAHNNIYSVSFGARNSMNFYHGKHGRAYNKLLLEDGDVLVFDRMIWHGIGTNKSLKNDWRLNVTFRMFKTI